MRRAPLLAAVLILLASGAASANEKQRLAEALGVSASSIALGSNGDITLSGERDLVAGEILAQEGLLSVRNGEIRKEGQGRILIGEMMGTNPKVIGALLGKAPQGSCEGASAQVFLTSVILEADADGVLTGSPERVIFPTADLTLSVGEDCVAITLLSAPEGSFVSADGSVGLFSDFSLEHAEGWNASLADLRLLTPSGAEALRIATVDGFFSESGEGSRGALSLTNVVITPATFLYPDLLERIAIETPELPMRIDLSGTFDLRSGANFSLRIDAERIVDLDIKASLTGEDLISTPERAAVKGFDIKIKDEGLFKIIEGIKGKALPDMIREGDLPGLPAAAKSDRFGTIRTAIADWIGTGDAYAVAEPAMAVPFAAIGAGLLFSPARVPDLLNMKTESGTLKENP